MRLPLPDSANASAINSSPRIPVMVLSSFLRAGKFSFEKAQQAPG